MNNQGGKSNSRECSKTSREEETSLPIQDVLFRLVHLFQGKEKVKISNLSIARDVLPSFSSSYTGMREEDVMNRFMQSQVMPFPLSALKGL